MTPDDPSPQVTNFQPPASIDDEYQISEPAESPSTHGFRDASEKSSPERLLPGGENKFRCSIADLMILTFGISLGMAGGTWIHPGLFSLLLGLIMLGGLAIYNIDPPETHRMKIAWASLLAGYISSVIAAMIKYSPIFSD